MASSPRSAADGSSSQREIHPGHIWLFKFIMLLFPLLVLAAIEGFFAVRFRLEYPNSSLAVQGKSRFVAAPYRIYGLNPGYVRLRDGVTYRYNNCGFREDDDLGAKRPNEYRVFLMGGSAAYGSSAREGGQYRLITGQPVYSSSQTIAAYLEAHLQQLLPHREVNVINAAVPNYGLHHVFFTYLGLVRLLSPDLIVTMDGHNEYYGGGNPYGRAISVEKKSGPAWVSALRQHSYLFYYLGLELYDLRREMESEIELTEEDFAAIDFQELRREIDERYEGQRPPLGALDGIMKVYELFWNATRLDGVPILFTVQPIPALDHTKVFTPEEQKLIKYLHHVNKLKLEVGHLADRLKARAQSDPDFHFESLLQVFEGYDEMAYIDYCHISPGGNEHLAKHLTNLIARHPEWTRGQPSRGDSLPVMNATLGVDPSCGGLASSNAE